MLAAKRTSGFGSEPADGLQNAAPEFAAQAKILAKLIELAPRVTSDDRGTGFEHEGKSSGVPWLASALAVSHGLKAGTKETEIGKAPTLWGYDSGGGTSNF